MFDAYEAAITRIDGDLALIRNPGIEDEAFDRAQALADVAGLTWCGSGINAEGGEGETEP